MGCGIPILNLPEINIISGDSADISWTIQDNKGALTDIQFSTCTFSMAYYSGREDGAVIVKECTATDMEGKGYNTFVLSLTSEETLDINGIFIYQLTITQLNGKVKSKQGVLNIYRNMNLITL